MNLGTFIVVSTTLLIQSYVDKYRDEDFSRMLQEFEADLGVPRIRTYDYIVVGGGSAGCAVAGMLSERCRVLLLEAGGTPVPQSNVPAYRQQVHDHPATTYRFTTVPQPGSGANREFPVRAGKILGGSGSVNGYVHSRGSPHGYNEWARLTGDTSWAYDGGVVEYFKQYENFEGILFDEGHEELYYGHGGPLKVTTFINPFLPVWFEAARELGYAIGDANGRQRESFTPIQTMVHEGKRITSYKGFVQPFEGIRANLTVLRHSDVEEVLINDQKRAYGVAYSRHGIAQRAHARHEVIISGGYARSPLLLMKSGIGPADVLAEAGIPVRVERPGVGLNMREHIQVSFDVYVNDSSLLGRIHDGDEAVLEEYHATGGGLLGEPSAGALAFLVSNRAKTAAEGDWPDIQLQASLKLETIVAVEDGFDHFNLKAINMRAKQRGRLRLNSTAWRAGERDDQQLAVIDLQHLSDESDVEVLIDGLKVLLAIVEDTAAFRRVNASHADTPHPQCAQHDYRSDAYWRCWVRWAAVSYNHRVGTCKMGTADDPLAVVDSELRVIGVEGLRVMDASVMPTLPNTNINAASIMIGVKGADLILNPRQPPPPPTSTPTAGSDATSGLQRHQNMWLYFYMLCFIFSAISVQKYIILTA